MTRRGRRRLVALALAMLLVAVQGADLPSNAGASPANATGRDAAPVVAAPPTTNATTSAAPAAAAVAVGTAPPKDAPGSVDDDDDRLAKRDGAATPPPDVTDDALDETARAGAAAALDDVVRAAPANKQDNVVPRTTTTTATTSLLWFGVFSFAVVASAVVYLRRTSSSSSSWPGADGFAPVAQQEPGAGSEVDRFVAGALAEMRVPPALVERYVRPFQRAGLTRLGALRGADNAAWARLALPGAIESDLRRRLARTRQPPPRAEVELDDWSFDDNDDDDLAV